MLTRFHFLVILIKSILVLSVLGALQPASAKHKSDHHPGGHEPVPSCPYNNNGKTLFAHGLSKCKKVGHPSHPDDLDEEEFAKLLTHTVLSIPALKRFLKWQIPVNEQAVIFYNLDYKLLKDLGNPLAKCLADGVKMTIGLYHEFPLQKYFLVVGYLIAQFLADNSIPLGPNAVQCYAHFLEKCFKSSCIVSHTDLFNVLLDAFLKFIVELGFDLHDKINLIFEIFTTQLLENVDTKPHW